jgi:hypothetical protein
VLEGQCDEERDGRLVESRPQVGVEVVQPVGGGDDEVGEVDLRDEGLDEDRRPIGDEGEEEEKLNLEEERGEDSAEEGGGGEARLRRRGWAGRRDGNRSKGGSGVQ